MEFTFEILSCWERIFEYIKNHKDFANLLLVSKDLRKMMNDKLEVIDAAIDNNKSECIQNTVYTRFAFTRRLIEYFNHQRCLHSSIKYYVHNKSMVDTIKFMLTGMNFVVGLDQNIVDKSVMLFIMVRDRKTDAHKKIVADITKNYVVSKRILNFIDLLNKDCGLVEQQIGYRLCEVRQRRGYGCSLYYDMDTNKYISSNDKEYHIELNRDNPIRI